jgi:CheY-specific phosphatase CheX
MTSLSSSPLHTAASSTFEALAFLVPSADPTAAEQGAPYAHAVSVAVLGPFSGRLELRVSADVARSVAENMLGADDADPMLVRDALGELTNVVCGNLLPELAGRRAVFQLSAPRALALDAPRVLPTNAVTFGVDGGRAELALHLDGVSVES